MNRFKNFSERVSKNNTKTCWVLKCDIKKFFANIDHQILIQLLEKYIPDKSIIWLLEQVIKSFPQGLPLGNLTSQLLVNIYMNEFDQFVKHQLKEKYYIRYADDFVFFLTDKSKFEQLIFQINTFITQKLKLNLHPNKVFIQTYSSGIDFLGWIHFPTHRILRTSTKRRILRNTNKQTKPETAQSYLGLLRFGNSHKFFLEFMKKL